MTLKLLAAIFFLSVNLTSCARILCIFPAPLYSHQSVFQPIWRTLSERGHDVTVITPNPLKNSSLTTLREIDISFSHKLLFEDLNTQKLMTTESNILILMKHIFYCINNITSEQLTSRGVQELIRNKNEKFDLLILEIVPAYLAFAQLYDCPIIGISSFEVPGYLKNIMGDIHNPVLSPHINLPYVGRLNFFQRLVSVAFEHLEHLQTLYLLYPIQQKIIREILNDPHINLFEIMKNVSLIMSNSMPGFGHVAPTIPSILELNGIHIKPPKVLPEDIRKFLDGGDKGVIYFSFGSSVKSYLMSEQRRQIFIDVFKELPFRVLWKYEDEIEGLPANVKTVVWAQQQDVLRHKNVKLFITQAGIQSVEESIRFKVPMLGCPFYADQFYNTNKIVQLKLGSRLDLATLTKETLKKAILDLVDNNSVRESLEEMSDLLVKDPRESLDKAIWAIEYVIKYKGAKHLQSPIKDLPFYQYYLLDVILFFVVILLLIFCCLLRCFRSLKRSYLRTNYKLKRQ